MQLLSVVVPLFNEQENIPTLYRRLTQSLSSWATRYELLLVDDGSSDGSLETLKEIAEADPAVRVVQLSRNFGQTPAMRAGIDAARGDVIITMDGDLQNDPQDIRRLVEKLDEGYDLVTGWRKNRQDPGITRKLPSKIANWLIRRVTEVRIHDTGCSLKAYRAWLIKGLPLYSELHRFIPAMSSAAGARIAEIPVNHHPRRAGKSKYGLSRTGKVVLDLLMVRMLISCARKPLHWFGTLALSCFVPAMIFAVYALTQLAAPGDNPPGLAWFTVGVLLAWLTVHLLATGIVGELAVRSELAGPAAGARPDVTHY